MSRTNYIFIDFENVPETDLDRIAGKPAHVILVLGERHKTLPVSLVKKLLKYASQVKLVETGRSGKNALDMVLASHVGSHRAADPEGYFHIVAKDKDYKAVIGHFKDNGWLAAQHDSLAGIPFLMNHGERLKYLQDRYQSKRLTYPKNKKTLETQIQSQFAKSLKAAELTALIQALIATKIIKITGKDEVSFIPQG